MSILARPARFIAEYALGFVRRFRPPPKPPCQHPHATEKRWLDELGTPMRAYHCPDCPAADFGHVYADPATWLRPEDEEEVYDPG